MIKGKPNIASCSSNTELTLGWDVIIKGKIYGVALVDSKVKLLSLLYFEPNHSLVQESAGGGIPPPMVDIS